MRVRAYPIKSIEYGTTAFNCWHDQEFMDLLREHDVEFFHEGHQIEITKDNIEDIETTIKTRGVKDSHTKLIMKDLKKLFKEYGEDYIVFDCF